MSKLAVITTAAIISVLSFSGVSEALMAETTLTELVKYPDSIVVGTVAKKECVRLEKRADGELTIPNYSEIVTLVTFDIQRSVKNPLPQSRIIIVVPGGKIGDLGIGVEDTAEFTVGERCIVFLNSLGKRGVTDSVYSTRFTVSNGFLGKYNIENNMAENPSQEFGKERKLIPLEEALSEINKALNQ